LSKLDLQ
jgi:hypothetical protein